MKYKKSKLHSSADKKAEPEGKPDRNLRAQIFGGHACRAARPAQARQVGRADRRGDHHAQRAVDRRRVVADGRQSLVGAAAGRAGGDAQRSVRLLLDRGGCDGQ